MSYQLIQVHTEADKVGVITLNRPKQLNALSPQLMVELGQALKAFEADPNIGCMIITGSEKAFAAGADIGVMAEYTFADAYGNDYITRDWETIRSIRKPVIAAVRAEAEKLQARFDADRSASSDLPVDDDFMALARGAAPVKVLARGDISKKLTVRAHKFSGKAAEKLAAAGGTAETIAS